MVDKVKIKKTASKSAKVFEQFFKLPTKVERPKPNKFGIQPFKVGDLKSTTSGTGIFEKRPKTPLDFSGHNIFKGFSASSDEGFYKPIASKTLDAVFKNSKVKSLGKFEIKGSTPDSLIERSKIKFNVSAPRKAQTDNKSTTPTSTTSKAPDKSWTSNKGPGVIDNIINTVTNPSKWMDAIFPSAYQDIQTKEALEDAQKAPTSSRQVVAGTLQTIVDIPRLAETGYRVLTWNWDTTDKGVAKLPDILKSYDAFSKNVYSNLSGGVPYERTRDINEQNFVASVASTLLTVGTSRITSASLTKIPTQRFLSNTQSAAKIFAQNLENFSTGGMRPILETAPVGRTPSVSQMLKGISTGQFSNTFPVANQILMQSTTEVQPLRPEKLWTDQGLPAYKRFQKPEGVLSKIELNNSSKKTLEKLLKRMSTPFNDVKKLFEHLGGNVSQKNHVVSFEINGMKTTTHAPHGGKEPPKGFFKDIQRLLQESGVESTYVSKN